MRTHRRGISLGADLEYHVCAPVGTHRILHAVTHWRTRTLCALVYRSCCHRLRSFATWLIARIFVRLAAIARAVVLAIGEISGMSSDMLRCARGGTQTARA